MCWLHVSTRLRKGGLCCEWYGESPPDLKTACHAWILAGGAHHTCYSQNITTDMMEDFAEIGGVEFVSIGRDTSVKDLKNELRWNEWGYR